MIQTPQDSYNHDARLSEASHTEDWSDYSVKHASLGTCIHFRPPYLVGTMRT